MALNSDIGGSSANSFASLAEAEDYFSTRPHSDSWDNLDTDAEKESMLVFSTTLISTVQFKGIATSPTQSLPFPRSGLILPSGYALDITIVPNLIKVSQFETALRLITRDISNKKEQFEEGIKEVKADVVTVKFADSPELQPVPDFVYSLIPPSWVVSDADSKPKSAIAVY